MGTSGSLNHIYRTVWNQALGAMVAVAEISTTRGKSISQSGTGAGEARTNPLLDLRTALLSLAIAMAWSAMPTLVQANPRGGVAIQGQATFVNSGNKLLVTTQNGAGLNHSAINWQSFSIPVGSSTYFQQPSASSTSINRVVTNTPSLVFGTLGSNGNLVLVNQSGITVGAGAVVDTAGFTASALRMSDADALSGRLRFGDAAQATGAVSVMGSVLARSGDVVLMGASVDTGSNALVQAPNGSTVLAAGQQIEITGRGLEGIVMQVQAPTDRAVNLGTLKGDAIGIFAGTLKHSGLIQATTATLEGGKVVLKASGDVVLDGSGAIDAQGTQGGSVDVIGKRVALMDQARIDASGAGLGGVIRVGGDPAASATGEATADFVYVATGASLHADGFTANKLPGDAGQGSGGSVTVWSEDTTRMYGTVTARGGPNGGDGGHIETSGKAALDVTGALIDASAPQGANGQWLLDPSDITVVHGTGGALAGGLFDPATSSSIGDAQINSVLNGGTDVTLQTSAGSGGTGAIVVNGAADVGGAVVIANSSGGARGLTLATGGSINIHSGASIAGSLGNALNVTLNATGGNTINGSIDNQGGSTSLTGATAMGGTIKNGTLLYGATLTSNGATLDAVTLGNSLTMNGALYLNNGLTLANGVIVNKNNSTWYFGSTGLQHIAVQGGTGSATLTSAGGILYAGYTPGGTLQIDAGMTLQGYGQIANYNASALTNNGSIIANAAGQTFTLNPTTVTNNGSLSASSTATLTVNPLSFVNTGTVSASPSSTLNLTSQNFSNAGTITLGGSTQTLGVGYYNGVSSTFTNLLNTGSIALTNGTLNLNVVGTTAALGGNLGAMFSNRVAGTVVNFGGDLDNTGNTLNVGSAGLFGTGGLSTLSGSISKGTISNTDATPVLTSSNGTLDGVSLGSNLNLNGGVFISNGLTLAGGISVNKGNGSWYFNTTGLQHIAMQGGTGSATINSAGGAFYAGYGVAGQTLQVDVGVTVQGYGVFSQSSAASLVNNGSILANVAGQTFTLNPGSVTNNGSLTASSTATLTVSPVSFVNSATGTVAANAGATLNLTPQSLSNAGSVTLGGSTQTLGLNYYNGIASTYTNLLNTGSIALNNGTLNLRIAGSAASLGGNLGAMFSNRVVGTFVNFGGELDNTGNTLDVGSAGLFGTGGLSTLSGSISKGVITNTDATPVLTSSSATLDGVTLGSNLNLNGAVFISNGMTLAGGITVNKNNGTWYFNTTGLQHIAMQGGTGGATINSAGGTFYAGYGVTGQTLQIDTGVTLQGYGNVTQSSVASLVNNGSIIANTAGQTLTLGTTALTNNGSLSASSLAQLTVNSTSFANTGTVSASSNASLNLTPQNFNNAGSITLGGATHTLGLGYASTFTNLLNTGSITLTNGTLNLNIAGTTASLGTNLGAMFSNRVAGTFVNFGGDLDNTGATLNVGSAGLFGLGGLNTLSGSVFKGTVVSTDANPTLSSSNATLDGVTLGSNLNLSGGVFISNGLTLAGGISVNKGNGSWYFNTTGLQHIAMQGGTGSATINSAGGVFYAGYGVAGQTLQIDAGVTLQGYGNLSQSSVASLVNNGSILSIVSGQTFSVSTASFSNNGTIGASAGATFSRNASFTSTGSLLGAGTIDVGVANTLTNSGLIAPGMANADTTGTLTINGNLLMAAGSSVNVDVNSPLAGDYDKLNVTGSANLTAATLNIAGGASSGTFALVSATGGLAGSSFSAINYGSFTATPAYSTTSLTLNVGANSNASIYWDGGASTTNWADAANWSNDQVPDAGTTVYVGSGAGTVAVVSSGQSALALNMDANFSLTAGDLTLANASLFRGVTTISGGTLTGAGSITIALGGTLNWSGGTIGGTSPATLLTQAGSTANVTGGTLGANRSWTHNGTLNLTPAAWSNLGGLNHAAGSLTLNGAFTPANLTNFSRTTGSTLNLAGVLDLAGASLDLGSAGLFGNGGLNNLSGTIKNGTVGSSDGTALSTSSGTLDAITLGSNLDINGALFIYNGLTLADQITVEKDSGTWYMGTTGLQHLALQSGATSATLSNAGGNIYAAYTGGGSLQIDSGVTVQGYGQLADWNASTLTNNGNILAHVVGQTFTVSSNSFVNNGTASASSGATLTLRPVTLANATGGSINTSGGTVNFAPTSTTANWSNLGQINALGGTLNLGGNFTTAELIGSNLFSRSGGSVLNLTGTLDLAGGVLDIGGAGLFGSGGLSNLSGTIKNGTLRTNDGTPLNTTSGALDAVTLGSDLGIKGTMFLYNGLTLADQITVEKDSGTWYMGTTGLQHLALASGATSATLSNAGGTIYAAYASGGNLQIDSGVTVQGYGQFVDYNASTLINNGSIRAHATGQTLTISTSGFVNSGTASADGGSLVIRPGTFSNALGGNVQVNGGSLTIAPTSTTVNWSNAGLIGVGAGLLDLGGRFSTADLSGSIHFSRTSGSTVNLSGILDLAGGALDIGGAGLFGSVGLSTLSGTIKNGTLSSNDGTVLTSSGNASLDAITLGSNLDTNGTLFIYNGLTLGNGITVNKGNGTWYMGTTGLQHLALASGASAATIHNAGGTIYPAYTSGGSLQIDSGVTVQGYGHFADYNASTLTNNGSIIANTVGQTFGISNTSLVNNGTLASSGGTLTLNPGTLTNAAGGQVSVNGGLVTIAPTSTTVNWVNAGQIKLSSGTLQLGGRFTATEISGASRFLRTSGSLVNLTGTLDLAGGALDIGGTGLFGSAGLSDLSGIIKNGTLLSADGTALRIGGSGTLDTVTIGSDLGINGTVYLYNGLTLEQGVTVNKGNGTWYVGTTGLQHLALKSGATAATLNNAGGTIYAGYTAGGSLQIDSGLTVQGYGQFADYNASTLTNNGSIIANTVGQTLGVSTTSFVNNGMIGVVSGAAFSRTAGFSNNGVLTGSGSITVGTGAAALLNHGAINPGGSNAPGTLTINGDLALGSGSALNIELAGAPSGLFDALSVSGAVTGNAGSFGALNVSKINGYGFANASGDNFKFLTASSVAASTAFSLSTVARTSLTPTYSANAISLLAVPYALTITPDAGLSKIYGSADPSFTYTVSGFDANTGDAALANPFSGALGRVGGENVGAYAYAPGSLVSTLGYAITVAGGNTFGITPASLSVTANNASRSFNGVGYGGGNGVSYAGFVLGDTAASLGGTLSYSGTSQGAINVGNYVITPAGLNSNNYSFNYLSGQLTISAAALQIDLTGTRTYDGTNAVAATMFTLAGLLPGQTLTLSGSGTVPSKNVGSYTVSLGSLALGDGAGGGLASNYSLNNGAHMATITAAPLAVTTANVVKSYDGTTAAAGVASVASGTLFAGDLLSGGNFVFADPNAGQAGTKTVTVSGVTVLDGASSSNYALTYLPNSSSTINPAQLSLSASKIYDGNSDLTGALVLGGLQNGETLSVLTATASDAHVATPGKYVNSLELNDATGLLSNYQLPSLSAAVAGANTVTINPATLQATLTNTVLSKTYDGTTAAPLDFAPGFSITGMVPGDLVTLSSSGAAYNSAHVTTADRISVSGIAVNAISGNWGSVASDYTVASSADVAASIGAQVLTATVSINPTAKTFDGTVAATGSTISASFTGAIGGDAVALDTSSLVLRYSDAHVATTKTITASGTVGVGTLTSTGSGLKDGSSVNNLVVSQTTDYVLPEQPFISSVTGTITARPLTATASITAVAKAYDGTLAATGSSVSGNVTGTVGTDTLALDTSGMTLAFNDAHVATPGKTIAASGSVAVGALSSVGSGLQDGSSINDLVVSQVTDYLLAAQPVTVPAVAGTITAQALTASASIGGTLIKVYDGSTAAAGASVTANFSGALSGDTLVLDASGLTLNYNSAHVLGATTIAATGTAGFTISNSSANSVASDYSFTAPGIAPVTAGVAITPKSLTAAATIGGTLTKVYDGSTTASGATLLASLGGALAGDTLGLSANLDYNSAQVASATTIAATGAATLQVLSSGAGSVASDYSVTAPTIAPITAGVGITPAPLTVLGQLAANKVYDGSNLATLSGGSLGGLVLGDQLTLTQAGTFVSLNVGTAIPVLASNTISGAAAGNYALTQPSGLVANITQLGSVTFVGSTGTGGTNWSNPANWTNNVLPVAGNVGTVNVPSGATVTYDALAGATQLTAINNDGTVNVTGGLLSLFSLQPITSTGNTGSVNVTGGGLSIANVMKAADFSLSGNATVTGAGTFTVTNSFSQSAGSAINMGGAVSITQATGPLAVGNVSGSSVALQSGSGGVVQQAATGLTGFLTVKTMGGANLANVGNTLSGFAVADVSTNVPSSGNIRLVNNGALDVQGISLANGSVSIETHSPITVSSPITASGNIVLAAPTASPSSNITINSTVTSTAGSISIAAYNNFIQNSNLSAALAIDVSAGGSLTFGPGAYSIGNPVMYSVNGAPYMPPWIASTLSGGATDFVVAFLDQFQAVLDAQQMASIDDPLGLKQRGQEGIVVEGEICKP